MFEYYATAQLAFIDTANGKITNVGQPAIFQAIDSSPDGKQMMVVRKAVIDERAVCPQV